MSRWRGIFEVVIYHAFWTFIVMWAVGFYIGFEFLTRWFWYILILTVIIVAIAVIGKDENEEI